MFIMFAKYYELHYTGASHFDDFFTVISFSFWVFEIFLITKKDNSCLLICFVLQNCRTTIVENGDLVTDSQEVNSLFSCYNTFKSS